MNWNWYIHALDREDSEGTSKLNEEVAQMHMGLARVIMSPAPTNT